MSDSISTFFEAWQITDHDERLAKITSAVTDSVSYHDPRTPETLSGIQALNDYLGMFSANAPGWRAKVVKNDTMSDITRVTVAFSGMGPDGKEMVQHGQYFVEHEGDLVAGMVGFVGTGEPIQ